MVDSVWKKLILESDRDLDQIVSDYRYWTEGQGVVNCRMVFDDKKGTWMIIEDYEVEIRIRK